MPKDWSSPAVDLHLDLDTTGGRRSALEAALRTAIRAGRLAGGAPLPSTRALAHELGLSRGTVTAAYDLLVEQGYLTSRPGSGTRVADIAAGAPAGGPATAPAPPPRHDLRPGVPDLSAFPVRAWLASTRRVFQRAHPSVLGPGDPRGRVELRTALADHLGRTRGVLASPDQVIITSGYYQAVGLLGRVLHAAGTRTAALEDPGHPFYRRAVQRAGIATVPVPVDGYGAAVEQVPPDVGAVFLTPAHQYPTGVPLHPSRRHAVCAWARRTGGLIVDDDYDGEFRYDRRPVGALQGLAPDHVVYCGSASKTLGPALRLAWMVVPARLVAPIVRAKREADLYTEVIGQLVLADLIATHGFERHVRAARLRYRRRRQLLLDRVAAIAGVTAHGVPAGLSTLLTVPADGPREDRLLATCAERGLALRGLGELHHDPAGRLQGLLVGFAAPSERAYPAALDALCEILSGGSTAASGTR